MVDVERFGDPRRTNTHQVAVRAGLYRALEQAFGQAGIRWADCDREDRGDGVFVLARGEVAKAPFVASLPLALAEAVRAHNRSHPDEEQIRLRMALHAGEVQYDKHGASGAAINLTFRLLNARPLRAALAGSPGVVAVITSDWFFDEVVRHQPGLDAATFRSIRVAVKETTAGAWIALPDHPYPPDETNLWRRVSERSAWYLRSFTVGAMLGALTAAMVPLVVALASVEIPNWDMRWLMLSATAAALALATGVARRTDRVPDRRTFASREDARLDSAASELAEASRLRWSHEAGMRGLLHPQPLRVRWTPTSRSAPDLADILGNEALRGLGARLRSRGDVRDITTAFRQLPRRQVVVLGDAGAGKSTLATLLTLGLLDHPEPGEPVPVLTNLSSWHPRTMHLHVWLAKQLVEDYPFLADHGFYGPETALRLVTTGRVMPVLDGFDELPSALYSDAMAGIDRAAAGRPLVLTCRNNAYQAAVNGGGRVLATAAVVELEPVRLEDAAVFLSSAPPAAARWQPVLARLRGCPDAPAARALASPLMVTTARAAFGVPSRNPAELLDTARFPDRDAVERHLLDGYLAVAYAHHPAPPADKRTVRFDCTSDQAGRWLTFLAMHLDELASRDLAWWRLSHAMSRHAMAVTVGIGNALAIALTLGPTLALVSRPLNGLTFALVFGPSAGLAAGIAELLTAGTAVDQPRTLRTRMRPRMLGFGALIGLPVGLLGALTFTVRFYGSGVLPVLAVGLAIAVIATVLFGLLFGMEAPFNPHDEVSPAALLRSDRTAKLVIGLVVLLLLGFPFAVLVDPAFGVAGGLAAGIAYVLNGAYGRFGCVRLWLAAQRKLPIRLMTFLADAHRRDVLRQAGAVYQFRHVRLQEHLVSQARTGRSSQDSESLSGQAPFRRQPARPRHH